MKKYITSTTTLTMLLASLAMFIGTVNAEEEPTQLSRSEQAAAINEARNRDYKSSQDRRAFILTNTDLIQDILNDEKETLTPDERLLVTYYGQALFFGLDVNDSEAVDATVQALNYTESTTVTIYTNALTWSLQDLEDAVNSGENFRTVMYLTVEPSGNGWPNRGKFRGQVNVDQMLEGYLATGLYLKSWTDWFRTYVAGLQDEQALQVLDAEILALTAIAPNPVRDKWLSELIGTNNIRKRLAAQ